jgi:AraC-like DNA-binding protein
MQGFQENPCAAASANRAVFQSRVAAPSGKPCGQQVGIPAVSTLSGRQRHDAAAMPALPITDERWSGLPLLMCNMDPGLYRLEVHTPVLITRDDLGTQVEVLNDGPRRIAFRQAPLRFDLFPAGLVMDAHSDRPATKSLVVALPPEWMPRDEAAPDGQMRLRSRFQFADVELRRLVWRLTTHHRSGEPLGHSYNGAVSRTLVDRIVRLQLALDAHHPDSVGLKAEARHVVETLIDASLQEPPSSAALAAKVGMGLGRFLREFKVTFAATPHQYIQQRRLQRARDMLRDTDASLSTVALETGFASHSHFATVFRAATGSTPSDYRRVHQPPRVPARSVWSHARLRA